MENQVSPKVPRVLAIHDMSCLGRCSLTVVLPIMAACGIQAVPLRRHCSAIIWHFLMRRIMILQTIWFRL